MPWDQIKGDIDVLMVSETKMDYNYPNVNLLIDGPSTSYE